MIIGKTRTNQPVESEQELVVKPSQTDVIDIHNESETMTTEVNLTTEQKAMLDKYSLFEVYYYNNENDYHFSAIIGKNNFYGVGVLDDTNAYDFTASMNINTLLSKVFISIGSSDFNLSIKPLL